MTMLVVVIVAASRNDRTRFGTGKTRLNGKSHFHD